MFVCKKCNQEKPRLDFPFICKKSCYDTTCRECCNKHRCSKEKVTLRKWDAITDNIYGKFRLIKRKGKTT